MLLTFISPLTFKAYDKNTSLYRYEGIKPLLDKYKRPFTVLELWAHDGSLTFEIAQNYDAVCIMTEVDNADSLFKLCEKNSYLDNILLLKYDLSIRSLKKFGECEHIDVVILPDITQKFQDKWKSALEAALTLGDHIIIESPQATSSFYNDFMSFIAQKKALSLAKPDSKTGEIHGELLLISMNKKYLIKRRWEYKKSFRVGEYRIESNFVQKKFIKEKQQPKGFYVTDWNAGINLFTFKKLNGMYPKKQTIFSLLKPLGSIKHNDLRIFNIIIQGTKVVPIDCNENDRGHTAKELLNQLLNHFRKTDITLGQLFDADATVLEKLDNVMYPNIIEQV
jgi:hypothetical protein